MDSCWSRQVGAQGSPGACPCKRRRSFPQGAVGAPQAQAEGNAPKRDARRSLALMPPLPLGGVAFPDVPEELVVPLAVQWQGDLLPPVGREKDGGAQLQGLDSLLTSHGRLSAVEDSIGEVFNGGE